MVSIHDEETNSFIQKLTNEIIWLGGYRQVDGKNIWGWTDGSTWTYSKWTKGQPDDHSGVEDYLDFNWGGAGFWNDRSQESKLSFVCQKCRSGWHYFHQTGKCYKYFSTKSSPTEANDFCKFHGVSMIISLNFCPLNCISHLPKFDVLVVIPMFRDYY